MKAIFRFKAQGPGRGWWGPPKGDHSPENVSGGEESPVPAVRTGNSAVDWMIQRARYMGKKTLPDFLGGKEIERWIFEGKIQERMHNSVRNWFDTNSYTKRIAKVGDEWELEASLDPYRGPYHQDRIEITHYLE